ncbi:MAG: SAM-dependent methyltransferase, partial [Streptosporangiaceae bacterium]
DFAQPLGLIVSAVLHFVADDDDPAGLMDRYIAALAPGSYVALSHATADKAPPESVKTGQETYANATEQFFMRSAAEVERFFAGLELVPPYQGAGPRLAYLGEWGADDPASADTDGSRWGYCGVGRRP